MLSCWMSSIILAHTCPFSKRPVEAFLFGVDDSMVDTTTEKFLQEITDSVKENCINFQTQRNHIIILGKQSLSRKPMNKYSEGTIAPSSALVNDGQSMFIFDFKSSSRRFPCHPLYFAN